MKQIFYITIFMGSFFHVAAQQKDSIICPTIKLAGPKNNKIEAGKDAVISIDKSLKKELKKRRKFLMNGHQPMEL